MEIILPRDLLLVKPMDNKDEDLFKGRVKQIQEYKQLEGDEWKQPPKDRPMVGDIVLYSTRTIVNEGEKLHLVDSYNVKLIIRD